MSQTEEKKLYKINLINVTNVLMFFLDAGEGDILKTLGVNNTKSRNNL